MELTPSNSLHLEEDTSTWELFWITFETLYHATSSCHSVGQNIYGFHYTWTTPIIYGDKQLLSNGTIIIGKKHYMSSGNYYDEKTLNDIV